MIIDVTDFRKKASSKHQDAFGGKSEERDFFDEPLANIAL